jgi:hypothetical protein
MALTSIAFNLSAATLLHRYSFTAGGNDSVGAANGTLLNGAVVSGGAAVFNGSGAYVDLPNGLMTELTNLTITTWVTDNGSANWGRIFDFGFSTSGEGAAGSGTNYLFLSPQSGGGTLRAGIRVNNLGDEQMVEWAGTRLPATTEKHVALTIDAATAIGRLYVDGVLVGENTGMTYNPAQLGNTHNNWLGRSQWSADAYYNGSINEFRIYDGALTATEVQEEFSYGPDVVTTIGPVSFLIQPQSQTVAELQPVTFTTKFAGTPLVGIQWRRNGVNIPGATNSSYTIASTALTNHNAAFSVVLTNSYLGTPYTVTSSNAVLSVTADLTAPTLVSAASLYPNEVKVTFSEGVSNLTGTNAANYAITRSGGTLAVSAARFGSSTAEVILTTAAQTLGTNYTLTVNNVRDRANAANLIAANSQTAFVATAFQVANIGSPAIPGAQTAVVGGVDVTAAGTGISAVADQFTYSFQNVTNNFDVRVRVAGVSLGGTWTRAALMARDGLATNAVFAAGVATPGALGCHFESRLTVGGNATMSGSFPVNYPDTWLRLRRTGNVFDAFASLDGNAWDYLGTASISMSNIVQLGFALTAASAATTSTAQFRDFGAAAGTITTNASLPFEPLGPSSRRTALVISELMYNPRSSWEGTNNLEFIELWNSGLITEDLTGHKLTGEIDYTFPANTTIAPGQFLVVAKDPTAAQSFYGGTFLGPYTGKLANGGGTVRLRNELGGILLEVAYDTKAPWPVAADGCGHSLVLSRPSYGENDPRAWAASDSMGGSPGAFDHYGSEPARGVVINELLAHTDAPQVDYVELYNPTAQSVNLSGAWLSDAAGTNKYQIVNGTTIAARSFLAFTQTQLGFALAADGEAVYLVNSNQTRVLDAVKFDGQENGVSFGRYPNGAPGFQRLATVTQGTSNTPPRLAAVVINEVMYHPISEDDNDEFVELYNRSGSAVDLGGWRLQDGVSFTFPSNTVIAAGGYVVVAENLTNLLAKYPQLNSTNTFGNFSGKLSNSGERIVLAMPDELISTNGSGVVTTNIFHIPVNDVTYAEGGRWGRWSDGGGSSLELIDPDADTRLAPSWADSDESNKASWTTINVTNVMENGQTGLVNEGNSGYGVANRFEMFSQGEGEALVDNLEFLSNSGANLISNGDFASGTNSWVIGGVLRKSFAESSVGIGGSTALHLVSTGRGDTGPNKIARALAATAATGAPNTGTIRAQVRWLKGDPYVLLRVRGNWMEVSQRLSIPANLGTPGLINSRRVTNAGPAITEVSHAPVLPAVGQGVMVSARLNDPDGVAVAQLKYRLDPSATYTTVAMTNNNGLYSAVIPGQSAGSLMAFVVVATDSLAATNQFPAEAPTRECHVRWGESVVTGSIGTYRLWLTAANIASWTARERNANDPFDATFVYGNARAIYNVDTLYSGSPFHTPAYNGPLAAIACDYEVNFRPDERFLGSEPFVLSAYDVADGNFFFNDDSAQVDLTGNWIARKLGQQYNYRRHIHMYVNGQKRGTIYDDTQQPNSEMVAEYFPETETELRKIESWFEFADNAQDQGSVYATLGRTLKSAGGIDAKRYRWNWRPRATDDPNDWSAFTNLIAAVNNTSAPNYLDQVRTWMDVPNFLRPVITHHICGSWDSYAYQRGKNMFAARPDGQGWRLLMWDIEIALGAGGNGANDSIYNMFDSVLLNLIQNNPVIQREYLRGFQEAVDTSLQPGAADVALDERYAAFQQHGIPLISPQFIKNYIASRRAYLLTVLPSAAFAVSNPSYQVVTSSNVLTLTGTGPLAVENILVNSNAYAVTWTSATNWRVSVPLGGGTNVLNITATDRNGTVISNATGNVTANYTGSTVAPEGFVVINEIMAQPAVERGGFVEIYNAHTNYTFDLSGWRLNGVDYTFAPGATLPPRSYLVLAEDAFAHNQAYGASHVAFDTFSGSLDKAGETLTLFRPGSGTNEIVVDRVRYESAAPWPAATNGYSLQLVDAAQDNSRVANWSVTSNAGVVGQPQTLMNYAGTWRYQQTANLDGTGWAGTGYNDAGWPMGAGVFANVTSTPEPVGTTLTVQSGRITFYFRTWFNFTGPTSGLKLKLSGIIDDGAVFYLNGSELVRTGMPNSAVTYSTLASRTVGTPNYDLPLFVTPVNLVQGSNLLAVEVHQRTSGSSDIAFGLKLETDYSEASTNAILATPGAANSVAGTLAAFPPLWLNELQANNVTGPLDNFSQRDPWAEIFSVGGTNVSLSGYYLTDTYTNLTKWAFAPSAVASNGFTLIWCDNSTNQTTATSWHAGVSLASGGGSLALTRVSNGATQVVDYLNYEGLAANWSYGSVPDAQPFYRRDMFFTTPGATNNGASAPITVFINEWMADNTLTLADPADSNYEDWFELYNPGTNAVDVGGYFLTDNLTNKFQFEIPNNGHYVIPPGGYLLVWADNEATQNSTNRADLHAGFALAKGGEALGLFAADGTTIDAVSFGAQTSNVSEGRFPNGAANIYSMPTPTPRAANIIPNTAPVLAAISNRVVTLGQILAVTAIGSDSDAPGQTLAYSLTVKPVGATIGAASGIISWTPNVAPATNNFTVVVADNGTPSLTATQSFVVVTAPVPAVSSYALNGSSFTFQWGASLGQKLQVESCADLAAPIWQPVSPVLTGNGGTLSFTNLLDDEPQRYFRLRVMPP